MKFPGKGVYGCAGVWGLNVCGCELSFLELACGRGCEWEWVWVQVKLPGEPVRCEDVRMCRYG